MTNTEPTESQDITISKSSLANTANEMEAAAVKASVAGVQEIALGADRMQAAGELGDAGAALIAKGASDLTAAVDQKVMSERMAVLSDAVAVAGVVDIEEGAEMLAASNDVGVMSALVGMMSEDSLDHGMELARLSGELNTVGELVADLRMPVLSAFLSERAARLHEMSIEQIRIAISTEGVSQILAGSGTQIKNLGENEITEGAMRLAISDAAANESMARAMASDELAVQGIEQMVVGSELRQIAKSEAVEGAAEISAGSTVVGAALAIDQVANSLKDKSE